MQLQPGTYLQGDKYRIIRALGSGGFGITYLAEHELAERKVCIKEFFPKEFYNRDDNSRSISLGSKGSAAIMDAYKAKFIKEAKTIARLKHPNIIHIHDVFEENNTAYYVMEYIEGESLSDLVKRSGALVEAEAVRYIRSVAEALGYIHERKIMHLDVKPANVMLNSEDGQVVVIDFGLSKQYDEEGHQTSSTPVGISAGFAPMEQYQQGGVKEFSPETDIYSLGATLYYLVTGQVPPQAVCVADEGLPELPAHLSSGVRNAIERSMTFQRKHRPHSAKEFLALLEDNIPEVVAIPTSSPVSAPVSAPVDDKTSVAASAPVADERTVVGAPAPKAQPTPQSKKEWAPKYSAEKPKKSEETKKKSKWWLWLLIVAVVVIGGYLALSGSNDSETAKSEQVQNRQAEEIEKARKAEEKRQAEETEKARIAEEKRQAEESEKARIAEEKRKAEEAERARIAEEKRINDMVAQGLGRDGIYEVGDYYNRNNKKGVVFFVSDGGRHGKILSLDVTKLKWCTEEQCSRKIFVGASSWDDGKANTDEVVSRSDRNEYQAFVWCRNKGNDWYLPSKRELETIYKNESKINQTLSAKNGEKLIVDWHWSSTEDNENFARYVNMDNGNTYLTNKYYDEYVRAVSAF